ncbi:MAG: hypothetical protein L6W00_09005 [Lentisphaeria bacterium]|nr:MAG: hypothetical protein L6W00_09005 [Lentisphaeria bacterium]
MVEPELVNSENIKGLVEAFSEGYGSNNVVIDTIVLPGNQAEAPMPLYMMMKAKDFDALLEKHGDVQIVVNTIGLPNDLQKMKYWKADKATRPALFLLGMPSGRIDGLAEAIAKGDIAGIVTSIRRPSMMSRLRVIRRRPSTSATSWSTRTTSKRTRRIC